MGKIIFGQKTKEKCKYSNSEVLQLLVIKIIISVTCVTRRGPEKSEILKKFQIGFTKAFYKFSKGIFWGKMS